MLSSLYNKQYTFNKRYPVFLLLSLLQEIVNEEDMARYVLTHYNFLRQLLLQNDYEQTLEDIRSMTSVKLKRPGPL